MKINVSYQMYNNGTEEFEQETFELDTSVYGSMDHFIKNYVQVAFDDAEQSYMADKMDIIDLFAALLHNELCYADLKYPEIHDAENGECSYQWTVTTAEPFGERLQRFKEQAKLTSTELANELGTTRQAVWRWETGKRHPNYESFMKLKSLFPEL